MLLVDFVVVVILQISCTPNGGVHCAFGPWRCHAGCDELHILLKNHGSTLRKNWFPTTFSSSSIPPFWDHGNVQSAYSTRLRLHLGQSSVWSVQDYWWRKGQNRRCHWRPNSEFIGCQAFILWSVDERQPGGYHFAFYFIHIRKLLWPLLFNYSMFLMLLY